MGKSPYKKIAEGEMKGWIREGLIHLLPPDFYQDPIPSIKKIGGRVVGESKWRWAGLFHVTEGRGIFLKRDKTKGWGELLKYVMFPTKGRKEWFIANQLEKRNLHIPAPLGWMERVHKGLTTESYYLSEAIPSGVSLIERTDILKDDRVSTELVKSVIRVHRSGLLHLDFHAGNFLWDGESIFLVDLHRAKLLRSLSLDQRLWNLSHLFHSLRSVWAENEQFRFLDRYFEGDAISPQKKKEYLKKIHSWMDQLQKRQWASRSERCLMESTEYSVKKERGTTFYHRKDFPLDRIKRAVKTHLSIVQETPSMLIKQDSEVMVSIFDNEGDRICIKQFCYPRWWDCFRDHFRPSKGLKAWLGGNGLKVRGIPSVNPLALLEQKRWFDRGASFFIMEAPDTDEEMDRYLCKRFEGVKEKRNFIKAFASWLCQLHQRSIYHQDLKACNILVSKHRQGWNFRLLDLEDVRLNVRMDERKLFKNYLQLNTSTPNLMTRTDRLRFFKAYHARHPIIRNEKKFLVHLIQKSRERGIVYVSPEGVVKENIH